MPSPSMPFAYSFSLDTFISWSHLKGQSPYSMHQFPSGPNALMGRKRSVDFHIRPRPCTDLSSYGVVLVLGLICPCTDSSLSSDRSVLVQICPCPRTDLSAYRVVLVPVQICPCTELSLSSDWSVLVQIRPCPWTDPTQLTYTPYQTRRTFLSTDTMDIFVHGQYGGQFCPCTY